MCGCLSGFLRGDADSEPNYSTRGGRMWKQGRRVILWCIKERENAHNFLVGRYSGSMDSCILRRNISLLRGSAVRIV